MNTSTGVPYLDFENSTILNFTSDDIDTHHVAQTYSTTAIRIIDDRSFAGSLDRYGTDSQWHKCFEMVGDSCHIFSGVNDQDAQAEIVVLKDRVEVNQSSQFVVGDIDTKDVDATGYNVTCDSLDVLTNYATKPGSNVWTIASDERIKQNIVDYDTTDALSVINQVRIKQYNFIEHYD